MQLVVDTFDSARGESKFIVVRMAQCEFHVGAAAPAFTGSTFIEVGGVTFDCGTNSMPCIVDWDEDGRKDLFCGRHDG